MKKFAVTFRHQGSAITRIIEAPSRDYAMGCVCGFVYSCDEMPEHIAKLFQLNFRFFYLINLINKGDIK